MLSLGLVVSCGAVLALGELLASVSELSSDGKSSAARSVLAVKGFFNIEMTTLLFLALFSAVSFGATGRCSP